MNCKSTQPVLACVSRIDNSYENIFAHYTYALNDVGVEIISAVRYTDVEGNIITLNPGDSVSVGKCTECPTNPLVQINKTTNDSFSEVGDIVNYTITVTNTGDVQLTGVTVVDSLSPINTISDPQNLLSTGAVLEVGDSATASYSYTITASDVGQDLLNIAMVVTDQGVNDTDDAIVNWLETCSPTGIFIGQHGSNTDIVYLYDGITSAADAGDITPQDTYATRMHQFSEFRIDFSSCTPLPAGTTVRVYWTNFEQANNPPNDALMGLDVFLFNGPDTIVSQNWHTVETSPIENIPSGDQFFDFTITQTTDYIIISPLTSFGDNPVYEDVGADPWIYEVEFNGNINLGAGFVI